MNNCRPIAGIRRGFTLVELIAVIVVLAILAGVAVPKYFDHTDRARSSALQGALSGVRAGIANFYANTAMQGDARYPTLEELTTAGLVMQEQLPVNPYNDRNDIRQVGRLRQAERRTTSGKYGWCYFVDNDADPPVAVFWANTDDETSVEQNDEIMKANEL